ncbi:MAG: hypothetical protein AAB250_16290 [Bdellovibrionota bacterium]
MKTMKFIYVFALAAMVFASIDAGARDRRRDEQEKDPKATKIIQIVNAGEAGRIVERLINRSNSPDLTATTIAEVSGDGVRYTSEAGKLRSLRAFSEQMLTVLAQGGQCDRIDSDCIVFEDKKDQIYRVRFDRQQDGAVLVTIGDIYQYGSGDNSLKGLIKKLDKAAGRDRSIVYTRANY